MTVETQGKAADAGAETRRFILFVALGGCAAAVNWLSRLPLGTVLPFSAAVIAAYIVGMAVAFTLFSRYVFPASPRPFAEQVKFFVLVNLAGVLQVWLVRSPSPWRMALRSASRPSPAISAIAS